MELAIRGTEQTYTNNSYDFAYQMSWDRGAELLSESVISSITDFQCKNLYIAHHPIHGDLEVVLSAACDAVVLAKSGSLESLNALNEEKVVTRSATILPFRRSIKPA